MGISVEQVRAEREAREARAREIAATLPPGEYFAMDNFVVSRTTREKTECESHWDVCLVMMAVPTA